MELQRAKGTRDFLPREMISRNRTIAVLREVFERYGFSPLETPILERYDVLAAKYAGGAEILNETFTLKDQGKRELGLRYDLTVPFSRVIAMNPQLKLPFKRYQIGPVFRDGPLKLARYREFYQCDVDVVGSSSIVADAELLRVAQEVFKQLKLQIVLRVNSRKISNALFSVAGVPKNLWSDALLAVDKLAKIGKEGVIKELKERGISQQIAQRVLQLMDVKGTNAEKLTRLEQVIPKEEGLEEIRQLVRYVPDAVFDVSLARGFVYYTSVVFEVYLKNSPITSSVAAGGRYDKIIGEFIGKGEYPATGISFGLDVIELALRDQGREQTVVELYLIPIKTLWESFGIAEQLRNEGLRVDLDVNERGVKKCLEYANKYAIPYVLFVGEDELKQKNVKLRDMKSGKETLMPVADVVAAIRR